MLSYTEAAKVRDSLTPSAREAFNEACYEDGTWESLAALVLAVRAEADTPHRLGGAGMVPVTCKGCLALIARGRAIPSTCEACDKATARTKTLREEEVPR